MAKYINNRLTAGNGSGMGQITISGGGLAGLSSGSDSR